MFTLDGFNLPTFTLASIKSPELMGRNSLRVALEYAGSKYHITAQSELELCMHNEGTEDDNTASFSFQQDRVTFHSMVLDIGDEDMARGIDVLEVLSRDAMFYQGKGIQTIGTICPNLKFRLESISIEFTPGVETVYNLLKGKVDCTERKILTEMQGLLQSISFKFNEVELCKKRLEGENYLDFLKRNEKAAHATDKQKRLWMMDLEEGISLEMNRIDKFTVSIAPLHHFEVSGTTVGRARVHDEEGRTTFRVGQVIVFGKIYFCDKVSHKDLFLLNDKDIEEETLSVAVRMSNREDFEQKLLNATLPEMNCDFSKYLKLRVNSIFIPTEIVEKRLVGI